MPGDLTLHGGLISIYELDGLGNTDTRNHA